MAGRILFAAITVTLALALLADAASAQDYIVRDGSGRRVGTVEKGIGERLIQRDASGRRTGTIEPGIGIRRIKKRRQKVSRINARPFQFFSPNDRAIFKEFAHLIRPLLHQHLSLEPRAEKPAVFQTYVPNLS